MAQWMAEKEAAVSQVARDESGERERPAKRAKTEKEVECPYPLDWGRHTTVEKRSSESSLHAGAKRQRCDVTP